MILLCLVVFHLELSLILGRAALGQKKAKVGSCAHTHKGIDDGFAKFKTSQKVLNKEMMSKEYKGLIPMQREWDSR